MSIFESKETMPPEDNPNVVHTALTMTDARRNSLPASLPQDRDVRNLAPVYRGKHY
jgi:hypothetical protein